MNVDSTAPTGDELATSVPRSVKRALAVDFGAVITGYLSCVVINDDVSFLIGIIFKDTRGRFGDGTTIRTSSLYRSRRHDDFMVVETVGGSCYVVCDVALSGCSPLFTGIRH